MQLFSRVVKAGLLFLTGGAAGTFFGFDFIVGILRAINYVIDPSGPIT